jgi:hypothetical protein
MPVLSCAATRRWSEEPVTFIWENVHSRRKKIAKGIQKRLGLSLPFAVDFTFHGPLPTAQNLADQPLWRVPFYVIAQRMIAASNGFHIIDHAWWLFADDETREPWGFVTEPYIALPEAERVADLMRRRHESWGVDVRVLSPAESAWLPGSTVPIVVTASMGWLPEFLRQGVGAALEALSSP